MTTHIMCDTETLGTKPGAIVTSVALVRFADEAHTTINLSVPDQQALALVSDPATEAWWMQQDPVARTAAFANPVPLRSALQHISNWIEWASPVASWTQGANDTLIWCHGAGFDGPLLEAVYKAAGMPCPWHWASVRCTRTLYDLAGIDRRLYDVPPPHIALNDAIAQTRAANAALKVLARAHQ